MFHARNLRPMANRPAPDYHSVPDCTLPDHRLSLSVCQAIRENCRRAEKGSAEATRVKMGLEGIVSKRLGSRYR